MSSLYNSSALVINLDFKEEYEVKRMYMYGEEREIRDVFFSLCL